MRQRRRPPSCELGQLRPLQQIAQFVAAQAAVLHQAALARGYLSGADTHNTEHIPYSISSLAGTLIMVSLLFLLLETFALGSTTYTTIV